jgi:hypothetical protein
MYAISPCFTIDNSCDIHHRYINDIRVSPLFMFKFIVPLATTEKLDRQQYVSEELVFF